MTLWFVIALMTAAAVFAVLWPLRRHISAPSGSDVAVYRDQLEELERDRAAGLIGEAEAGAARVEVSRRLIAAADTAAAQSPAPMSAVLWRRRVATLAGLLALPLAATALYLTLGSPQMPGEPLASRAASDPHQNLPIQNLISQVEGYIARNPQDGRGWEVLAPVYLRLGRYDDAINALRKSLAINGETAERQADLGEAMTAAANGVVTAEAKSAFDRALALDGNDLKAKFFIGMAAQQDGRRDEAATIWRAMLANAPPDAPWIEMVKHALNGVDGSAAAPGASTPAASAPAASAPAAGPPVAATTPGTSAPSTTPGPSAADMAAAAGMGDAQRNEMVRGMVARLAERLAQDGSDVEGWQRLLRAYMVLGEPDKARSATGDARRALAREPDKLRRLDEFVKGLGLEG